MNIHEYQSKQIMREYGIHVPEGYPAFTVEDALENAKRLDTPVVVVKAQIHAGGRGEAGGVKLARSLDEVRKYAKELLGKVLVTRQTGPQGKTVNRLLIEAGCHIKKEYYLSFVVDRQAECVVMMGSESGGMSIEDVAAENPEKIIKEYIDPVIGLADFQAQRMAYALHFEKPTIRKAATFMKYLYNVFVDKDCSLAEVNPLVVTEEGDVMALDAKLNFDDSTLSRHPEIVALRDITEEDQKEREAAAEGLNYVNLGGDVACMVNGAGLAMATVDIIKENGGEPANFLDVGGDSTPEKIVAAFRIMLEDDQVDGILINIIADARSWPKRISRICIRLLPWMKVRNSPFVSQKKRERRSKNKGWRVQGFRRCEKRWRFMNCAPLPEPINRKFENRDEWLVTGD